MQRNTVCDGHCWHLQAPSHIEKSPFLTPSFSHQSEHDAETLGRQKSLNRAPKFCWKKKKKKKERKKKTSAPFCALAAKNKLVIEKEKKGTRLLAHKATLRDGGGVGEGWGGRSYVRGRLYGSYSQLGISRVSNQTQRRGCSRCVAERRTTRRVLMTRRLMRLS